MKEQKSTLNLAPIVLFVYNRPWHTKQTVEALQKNELAQESELFVYSDEAKNEDTRKSVDEVREYIDKIDGFKKVTIIKREKNWGLADSIIDGVTKIVNEYGNIIVLEDDLVTSPYFLKFMNEALEVYDSRKDIFSITGFSFSQEFMKFDKSYIEDIYLNIRPMSWSWATWKDRWVNIDWKVKDFDKFIANKDKVKKFNKGGTDLTDMLSNQINGKVDSWYIRWSYHAVVKNLSTIYPKISFVNNIGHDGSGVHCGSSENSVHSHSEINLNSNFVFNKKIILNTKIVKNFNKAFNIGLYSKFIKVVQFIGVYPLLKKLKDQLR